MRVLLYALWGGCRKKRLKGEWNMGAKHIAFMTKLVNMHGRQLVELAYRYTGNEELAKDLVQETWLTAWYKIDFVIQHENPTGWLYKTFWNLTRREISKAHYSDCHLDPELLGDDDVGLPTDCYLPKGLNERERKIILMRIDRQLSYAEIAETQGITQTACRQQVSRAFRKCKKLLELELNT